MNIRKRLLSIIATLALFVACCPIAYASDIQPRASEYLSQYTIALTEGDSAGEIKVIYSIIPTRKATVAGLSKIEIYKENGSYVTTIFGNTTNGLLTTLTTAYCSGTYVYSGVSGTSYYAKVTVYGGNATASDTRNITTRTVASP